jgi:hypothetical protein
MIINSYRFNPVGIQLVASVSKASSGAAVNTTNAIDTTGSNLLVAVMPLSLAYIATAIVTDSKSNTWIALTSKAGANSAACRIFYCLNGTVGSGHTFSSGGGSNLSAIHVSAWKNVQAYSAEIGADTAISPGSITPGINGCLIIQGIGGFPGGPSSITEYTITTSNPSVSGTVYGGGSAYLVQAGAAATNPTWSGISSAACVAAVFTP